MIAYFIILFLLMHNNAPALLYYLWIFGVGWEIIKFIL